jgi:hypothetical protein
MAQENAGRSGFFSSVRPPLAAAMGADLRPARRACLAPTLARGWLAVASVYSIL